MSIGLVEQLNFEKQMPIDGNCQQEISIAVPSSGSGDYSAGSYFLLNIPRCGPNHVFDPANSFLRFKVTNNDANHDLKLGHSADSLIQRLEVLYAGNVLEVIENYPQLSAVMLDTQVDPIHRCTSLNVHKGCSATLWDSYGVTIAHTASAFFSVTFLSGIVGSLCRSYIPTNDLQGSLQIRVTFSTANQAGIWADTPDTSPALTFNNIEFHANMIKLSQEVAAMVRAPQYTIYSESYSNFQQTLAAGTTQVEQILPTRYSSLKTVYLVQRHQAAGLNSDGKSNPDVRVALNLQDYCFRLGSMQIPASRVRVASHGFVEAYEGLKVALHQGGNSLAPLGIITNASYTVETADNSCGMFVLAQDFETYSGKSGALLSGVSTLGSDLFYSGTYTSLGAAALLDFYMHYDLKLVIENGMLTIHV